MASLGEGVSGTNRKKILYVEQSRVGTVGGSHTCLLELVRKIEKTKLEPVVMFYENSYIVENFREAGSRVIVLERPYGLNVRERMGLTYPWSLPLSPLLLLFQKVYNGIGCAVDVARLARLIKAEGFDLVHLNNSMYVGTDWLLASKLCGIKCVTYQRGVGNVPWLNRWTGRLTAKIFDGIVSVSESVRVELEAKGVGAKGKIVIIYDGVDPDEIEGEVSQTRSEARSSLGVGPEQPLVGMVGNIKWWKGQEVVVDAVGLLTREHPDLRCVFLGEAAPEDAEYMHRLEARVSELGISENVLFAGFKKNIYNFVNAIDVMVHASIEPEPFGRVLLEGMALQKPVIATKLGGPLEIIEDGVSGRLVAPGEPRVLAEAIGSLLRDEDLRSRMGREARRRVATVFSMGQTIRQTERYYEGLLSRCP
jgi:glycosyltransferase involved in cell wall biosynthesis